MTKILLVDDDPFALGMTEAVMEDEGFEVLTAESGEEALARVAAAAASEGQTEGQTEVQAVVSDMNMPGMDGLELYTALRQQGYHHPFILLTGDDAEPLSQAHPELDAVITKDADLSEQLPGLIKKLLPLA